MTFKKLSGSILLCFSLFGFTTHAQDAASRSDVVTFDKGTKSFSLGIGVGREYDYYGSYYYSNYIPTPTVYLIYDQGIIEDVGPGNIGIGGVLAFKNSHYKYGNGDRATWSNVIIGIRGTYHLTLLRDKNARFDPYGGVTTGVRIFRYRDRFYDESYGTIYPVVGLFVGAKYNFTKNIGAFAELGYDISFLRGGLSFSFN